MIWDLPFRKITSLWCRQEIWGVEDRKDYKLNLVGRQLAVILEKTQDSTSSGGKVLMGGNLRIWTLVKLLTSSIKSSLRGDGAKISPEWFLGFSGSCNLVNSTVICKIMESKVNSKFWEKESIFSLLTPGPCLFQEAGTIGIINPIVFSKW